MNNMRNKILSLLVLLLTAATGAWAQSLHYFDDLSNEILHGGNITLSHDYYKYESGDPIEISTSNSVIDGKGAIIDMEGANISHVFYISADNVTIKNLSIINYTGTGDAIYFSGSGGSVYNIGYDVALNRVTTANTWTLSMPASDVLLTPQYAPVAAFAVENAGTANEKTLLPAAVDGVIAGQDVAIVTAGTTAQGTVMYLATADATMTAAQAAVTTTGWSDALPKATVLTGNVSEPTTVYVWYYIAGADTPQGQTATAENTFNDSELCTAPLEVTLQPNVYTLTLSPAPVENVTVTIDGIDVTDAAQLQAGKIPNVQMGKTVKLAPKTGYKLRKVEVNKTIPKPAATVINPPTLPYIGFKLGFATMALVDAGEADGGTMKYKVTDTDTTPASTDGFSATLPRATDITAPGTYYLWYFVEGDADHSDSEIEFIGIVGALL